MPRIPQITSQRNLPASSGATFIRNANAPVAEAVADFGDALRIHGEKREEKQAQTAIFEAENELRTRSRDMWVNASENRLGKNALPDEATGYRGVYSEYETEADRLISERVAKIPVKYQDVAKQRLTGLASAYRDRFAAHQAAQESEHRKMELHKAVDGIKAEIYMDARGAGGADSIIEGFMQIEGMAQQATKGKDISAYLSAQKAEVYREAILAKAKSDPVGAKQLLEDKRILKVLDPSTVETLENAVEKKRVEKVMENTVAQLNASGISYAAKLELVKDQLKDDPDALKMVVQQIDFDNGQEEKIKREKQTDLYLETYEAIVDKTGTVTPAMIYADPKYEILDPSQREYLINRMTADKGEGGLSKEKVRAAADFFLRSDAEEAIYAGRMDEAGVRAAVLEYVKTGGERGIPPQYGNEMINNVQKSREAPQLGAAAQILKDENGFDKEDQARFNEIFYREVKSAQTRNGGKPVEYEKILEIGRKLSKPIHEDKWFQSPRFKDEKFLGLGAEEDAILAPVIAKQQGWDSADFDETSGFWYGRKGEKIFRFDPISKKTYEFQPK